MEQILSSRMTHWQILKLEQISLEKSKKMMRIKVQLLKRMMCKPTQNLTIFS